MLDGRRAVALAEAGADEILTGALAAYARALFFAGELDEAWAVAMQTLEHPAIEQAVPSLVVSRSTLALVAVERGRLASARGHAEKAKAAAGRIGTSRSWLGANASAALGSVLAAEGGLVEAEHELASAERFFSDEVATVHHTWLLVLLARVRVRRGRLAEADTALRSAREALGEIVDCGRFPRSPMRCSGSSSMPRVAHLAGRCSSRPARPRSPCCGCWPPICPRARSVSASSSRRTRSAHTRERCTTSLASTPARTRSRAPPRLVCWSKHNHPGEQRRESAERSPDGAILEDMPDRTARQIVAAELSAALGRARVGMTLTRTDRNAASPGNPNKRRER